MWHLGPVGQVELHHTLSALSDMASMCERGVHASGIAQAAVSAHAMHQASALQDQKVTLHVYSSTCTHQQMCVCVVCV